MKNGCHFININCIENFQIIDPLKVWVSGFLSVDGNGISVSAIMRKLKNGCHFINIDHVEKFQITNPPPGSISIFMHGYTFMLGYFPCESPMCSFTLPDI